MKLDPMKPAPPVTKIMQLPYQSNKHGLFLRMPNTVAAKPHHQRAFYVSDARPHKLLKWLPVSTL